LGLALATLAVAALTVGVVLLGTALVLTCAGFLVLMAVQAFIFGNASALAAAQAPHVAGAMNYAVSERSAAQLTAPWATPTR
jgi:MFS transporter, DHA1 family, multidrug resistance protein